MDILNRITYVPIEWAREAKNPLRRRYATTRRSLDRGVLRTRERDYLRRHPFSALARLVGASNRRGPVWGVTMVKNEEARIEGALRRLTADGVDAILVADNLSTDSTHDLLVELAGELPLVVLDYREEGYYQGQVMSLLARSAARCGASWIVPFDADELWFGVDGTIKSVLQDVDGDAAVAPMYDFLPDPDSDASSDPYRTIVRRTREPVASKVAFRAHLLASIAIGNHSVSQPTRRVPGHLLVRHYPFLSFEHFVRKARLGAAALDRTDLPTHTGFHWRERANREDDELREEWTRLCTGDLIDDPLPLGALG